MSPKVIAGLNIYVNGSFKVLLSWGRTHRVCRWNLQTFNSRVFCHALSVSQNINPVHGASAAPAELKTEEQNIFYYAALILTFELAVWSSTRKSQTHVSLNSVWAVYLNAKPFHFSWYVSHVNCQRDASWRMERTCVRGEGKQMWGCCGNAGIVKDHFAYTNT